jgi:hypothetical protein
VNAEAFRKLIRQQPFQPFRVVMSSGDGYEVRHPEMIMVLQSRVLIGTAAVDDEAPADYTICPLLHVAAVEPLEPLEPSSRAG